MADKYIARTDTFTKAGRYVSRGQLVSADEIDFEEGKSEEHLLETPAGINEMAVVEVSAIAPTGPNPKNPQQIAPDVVQVGDGYFQAGARLVGEVTVPEKQRIEVVGIDHEDDTQAKVTQALDEADAKGRTFNNDDDELVAGSVSDVTSRINSDTSEAELNRLRAAEDDREKPRKGVISAIDAELARREGADEA